MKWKSIFFFLLILEYFQTLCVHKTKEGIFLQKKPNSFSEYYMNTYCTYILI